MIFKLLSLCKDWIFRWGQTGFDFELFEHQLALKITCAITKRETLMTLSFMWGLTAEPVHSKKDLLMKFSDGGVVSHFQFYFVVLCPHVYVFVFFPSVFCEHLFVILCFCHCYACFLCFHVSSLILYSEYILACTPHVALVWTLLTFLSSLLLRWLCYLDFTFSLVFPPASVSFICKPTDCRWLWRQWHVFRTFYFLKLN